MKSIREVLEWLHYSALYADNKEPYITNQIDQALKEIEEILLSSLPKIKHLVVEEPKLYQGCGGSQEPFYCSGCQMSEMNIMDNFDEQNNRYYCKCSYWDTPHNAFLDKSGGNWLGWKNKKQLKTF